MKMTIISIIIGIIIDNLYYDDVAVRGEAGPGDQGGKQGAPPSLAPSSPVRSPSGRQARWQ